MKFCGAASGFIHSAGVTPEVGNQCNVNENINIKRSPIQKVGRENVVREAVTEALSKRPPLLFAAIVPRKIPITIDTTDETPRSRRVFSNRPDVTISVITGFPV